MGDDVVDCVGAGSGDIAGANVGAVTIGAGV